MVARHLPRIICLIPAIIVCIDTMVSIPDGVSGEWSTFHGDPQRTGYSDASYISGDIRWSLDIGNGYIDTSPIVVDDRMYFISAGDGGVDATVHCLSTDGETFHWNTTIPGKTYQLSTPVLAKDRLFFGSSSGIIYCLRANDGGIQWQRLLDSSFDGITSSPAFLEETGNLYVGAGDGTLYDLDIGTGNTNWSFDTGARIYFSSPAVRGNGVYIGNDDGNLFAVESGNEVWRYTAGDRIRSTPCIAGDGSILFTSEDGYLRSLDPSGSLNWEREIGASISTPAVHDDFVVAGSDSGIQGFALDDGDPRFDIRTNHPVESSPVLTEWQMFFIESSQPSHLHAADLDGLIQWTLTLDDHVLASPGFSADDLFIASDSSLLWSIHSTAPDHMNLTLHQLPERSPGEQTFAVSGAAFYDTGRPGAGADVQVTILGQYFTDSVGTNGGFSVNVTLDLPEGNHTVEVKVSDGTLTATELQNLHVRKGDDQGSGEDDSDAFISSFTIPSLIVSMVAVLLIGRRKNP